MKIVVFGLSISSAWGNGHATLLRGLFRALHAQGHEVHFFEKDVPYYAQHRDASSFPFAHLHLYADWKDIRTLAQREVRGADLGMITSYCPDAVAASELLLDAGLWRTVFYDMDTPVTFAHLDKGEHVPYLPPSGYSDFDLVLSYTGGPALDRLKSDLGARAAAPLYGWVDEDQYSPAATTPDFRADLSYLGTYSADRQPALDTFLITPASRLPAKGFIIAGAMYPDRGSWPSNIRHFEHIAPPQHPAFYSSSQITLNITRGSMARMGFCPSGRLFEATACGTALISDWWEGLDTFFEPGVEIIVIRNTDDVIRTLDQPASELARIAARGRERTVACHTASIRAQEFTRLIETCSATPEPVAFGRAS